MNLPSYLQILSALGAGGVISAATTYVVGKRQQKTSLAVSRMQVSAQVQIAEKQFKAQLGVEHFKMRQERLEEAYSYLMAWLYDIESTIDDIWRHICSEGDDHREAVRKLLRDWPWETLRPPRDAAKMRYYWDPKVEDLLDRFSEESSPFYTHADVANMDINEATRKDRAQKEAVRQEYRIEVWRDRSVMRRTIRDIRNIIRDELLDDPSIR